MIDGSKHPATAYLGIFTFPSARSRSVGAGDVRSTLSRISLAGTFLDDSCPKEEVSCQPQKYRHPTGHCNNVQNPSWGNAYTGYGRLLPAVYVDGISQVRMAASGKPLPNPIKVADAVHAPRSKPSHGYLTTLAAVWTQFVLNDISYPITFTGKSIKHSFRPE